MIGTIEQAIVDAIQAASGTGEGQLGYVLPSVASYGNELDEDLAQIVKRFPAVWVVYRGEPRPERLDQDHWLHRPTYAVIVATRNRRNERATRHGAAGAVGAYQILDDIRDLLIGRDLGLAIEQIAPGAVRALANARGPWGDAAIYALELTTAYESEVQHVDADGLDDFATFHGDWDLPPHGNVTEPLPAADPDAADTVTLPQE